MKDTSQTKPEECECCSFDTPDLKAYTNKPAHRQSAGHHERTHAQMVVFPVRHNDDRERLGIPRAIR